MRSNQCLEEDNDDQHARARRSGPVATNIIASLPPTYGPALPLRGPGEQFEVLMPETVGDQVADAIVDDTFIVYTHPEVRDVLVERASDWNSFVDRQADAIAEQA